MDDYNMREAVAALGGDPDDLRAQISRAVARFNLRRLAIESGTRPRRLPPNV
ncbi:hypothetical protein [Nocardia sp. NPDC050435]|uniref:hypothetical protein n=1 Tax=Nocardia sp. NPDC050435 TaxID=3155040 RepID=UPI0033C75ED7